MPSATALHLLLRCTIAATVAFFLLPQVGKPSRWLGLLLLALAIPDPAVPASRAPQDCLASLPRSSKSPEPERGYAAFYSPSLEGHKTACGGVYSPGKLTAAHASLPCGTRLLVTNIRNGKTVRVTVTDRGPLSSRNSSRDRIIDLSYAAARHLDFLKQGTTLVKLEVLR